IRLGALPFLVHVVLAGVAWRLLPHGFPVAHVRFWSNTIAPVVVGVVGVVGAIALLRMQRALGRTLALALATTWAVGALVARVTFPVSIGGVRWLGLALGAFAFTAALGLARPRLSKSATAFALALGLTLALVLVLAQRAPDPDTRPAGGALGPIDLPKN